MSYNHKKYQKNCYFLFSHSHLLEPDFDVSLIVDKNYYKNAIMKVLVKIKFWYANPSTRHCIVSRQSGQRRMVRRKWPNAWNNSDPPSGGAELWREFSNLHYLPCGVPSILGNGMGVHVWRGINQAKPKNFLTWFECRFQISLL